VNKISDTGIAVREDRGSEQDRSNDRGHGTVITSFAQSVRPASHKIHAKRGCNIGDGRIPAQLHGVADALCFEHRRKPEADGIYRGNDAKVRERQDIDSQIPRNRFEGMGFRRRGAVSRRFSSAFSQLASAGRSDKKKNVTTPSAMHGSPSSKNIHCQPAKPPALEKLDINQAEIGPPRMPPRGPARNTMAIARAMRVGPYQQER
jgi:hypothetical protein